MRTIRITIAALIICSASLSAQATPIAYNITWMGGNDFTLTGVFSIDDLLLGTGVIDQTNLLTFMIEGFDNGSSLGSFSSIPENFNFDTDTEIFVLGGESIGSMGQSWNRCGSFPCSPVGLGFAAGNAASVLTIEGRAIWDSRVLIENTALIATRKAMSLDEPGTLLMLIAGLLGILQVRRNIFAY